MMDKPIRKSPKEYIDIIAKDLEENGEISIKIQEWYKDRKIRKIFFDEGVKKGTVLYKNKILKGGD